MKICFLTHNVGQDNGAGVFSRALIEGVQEALDARVLVFSSVPAEGVGEIPRGWPPWQAFRWLWRLRRAAAGCDIVHALDAYPYGVLAVLGTLGLGTKTIITAVGSGSLLPLYRPRQRPLVRFAYRRAAALTAISAYTAREVRRRIPGISIPVIGHGVAPSFIRRDDERPRRTLPYPYILGVGALRARKGYHAVIRAFPRILEQLPGLHYVIVGRRHSLPYYEKLRRLIAERCLEERVHIREDVETREELKALYDGAELFCLVPDQIGYDVEGFGLVFLEAAARGLPVIGAKDSGVETATAAIAPGADGDLPEGANGFLVSGRDEDALVSAVVRILKHPQEAARMRASSLAFARAHTWDGAIRRYGALYKELGAA